MTTYKVHVGFEINGPQDEEHAIIDTLISSLSSTMILAGSVSVTVDEIPDPPDAQIIQFERRVK